MLPAVDPAAIGSYRVSILQQAFKSGLDFSFHPSPFVQFEGVASEYSAVPPRRNPRPSEVRVVMRCSTQHEGLQHRPHIRCYRARVCKSVAAGVRPGTAPGRRAEPNSSIAGNQTGAMGVVICFARAHDPIDVSSTASADTGAVKKYADAALGERRARIPGAGVVRRGCAHQDCRCDPDHCEPPASPSTTRLPAHQRNSGSARWSSCTENREVDLPRKRSVARMLGAARRKLFES